MRRAIVLLCWSLVGVGLTACGAAVSTSAFKGEQHEVAQTVANLQTDATGGEEKKICTNDLASAVVARLGGASRCEAAIKSQLNQVDNLEVSVQSVTLGAAKPGGAGKRGAAGKPGAPGLATASARVKSIHSGKHAESTVSLVKEGGKWKISALG
ncbi:MAG TPA: hypothetical protein VN892_00345 [Solirubrobacteraceae bacterium]|nr:hypothetical protein [Solirubrobacteraceae bacterium]